MTKRLDFYIYNIDTITAAAEITNKTCVGNRKS